MEKTVNRNGGSMNEEQIFAYSAQTAQTAQRVSAGSPTNFPSISFYFFFESLTCTHSFFFPLLRYLFLSFCTLIFHSTSTHTFRANKPRREGWLVNRKKKKKKKKKKKTNAMATNDNEYARKRRVFMAM